MARDMTKGSPFAHLILFGIPILLGNFFQLTYNAVDSILIANIAGTDALAAVGAAAPVFNVIILFTTGLTIGASVLMANAFGAKNHDEIKRTLGTMLVIGAFFTLFLYLVAIFGTRGLMRLMNVPPALMDSSTLYLSIVLFGTPFTYLYNTYSASMRAIGDSKDPVRYLSLSCILNAILDALFLIVFGWGVAGAAIATVLSQVISSLLCIMKCQRDIPYLRMSMEQIRTDASSLKQTLVYGSLTALSQCCMPIGKVLIQSTINTLGTGTIAVYSAAAKIEDFAITPAQSLGHSLTTYTGQNRGARQKQRIYQGYFANFCLEVCYWVMIFFAVTFGGKYLLRMFIRDPELIAIGMGYLGIMAFNYFLCGTNNNLHGFLRGMGKMNYSFVASLLQITVRVVMTFILVPRIGIKGVAIATGAGWLSLAIVFYPLSFVILKRYRPEE